MPNWANVTYKVTGERQSIENLRKILEELENSEEPIVPNGFGNLWLGCIVAKVGGDWNNIYCRGEVVEFYSDNDKNLVIVQETAWNEMSDFRHFLESVFPNIKIYYAVDEVGNGFFATNDVAGKYFPARYYVEGGGGFCEEYNTIEELAEHVSDIVGKVIEPDWDKISQAVEKFNESEDEQDDIDFMYCFKYIVEED